MTEVIILPNMLLLLRDILMEVLFAVFILTMVNNTDSTDIHGNGVQLN